jgi:DNA primase
MKTQGLEFREALKMLADQAGVTLSNSFTTGPKVDKSDRDRWLSAMQAGLLFFQSQYQKSPIAKKYCDDRGLAPDVTSHWELGYAPESGDILATLLKREGHNLAECKELFLVENDRNGGFYDKFRARLMFPIRDEKGDLVGFGGRVFGDGQPKYINSSDTPLYRKSRVLYGFHKAKEVMVKSRHGVLVEGYLDVIACHQAGVKEAVASLGTSLAEDHVRLLKRFVDKVTVLYDADSAGQKAALRALELFEEANLACRIALMPQGEDPDTLLRKKGAHAVRQAVENSQSPFDFRVWLLEKQYGLENDEFWLKLPELLARATSDMDLERHLLRLAGQHPRLKNSVEATRALRRDVKAARAKQNKPKTQNTTQNVTEVKTDLGIFSSAEAIVFRAILSPTFRRVVWGILSEAHVFLNSAPRELAEILSQNFSKMPAGEPSEWISAIESDELREVLTNLEFQIPEGVLSEDYLNGALETLRQTYESQKLSSERDSINIDSDADLRDFLNRLKKIKKIEPIEEDF